jgi:Fe-S-cluster-containing dehydrogenase component
MSHFKFIIDTNRCIGCNACTIACKDRAGLPDNLDLLRVERVESGKYPNVDMYYKITHCFHCENPPCLQVCPSGAISKDKNGFVLLDVNDCTGCGNCSDVCPFQSIIKLPNGSYMKCDGCFDEVSNGLDPTCVRACLTRALSLKKIDELDAVDRIDEYFNDYGINPSVIFQVKIKKDVI